MTSSPPPEAQHFRGKTLTPESPVPVHVPEPQNIPVLQNQIDPIFNLVSTHMEQPAADGQNVSAQDFLKHDLASPTQATSHHSNFGGRSGDYVQHNLSGWRPEAEVAQQNQTAFLTNSQVPAAQNIELSSINAQLSNPTGSALNAHDLSQQNQPQGSSNETSNAAANAQNLNPSQMPGHNPQDDVEDEGVNYQALLDNLTPSNAFPPSHETAAAAANSAVASSQTPNNVPTLISSLPIPAGLPARPPPQEKPAIHSNANADEDLRSYHNPTAQASNTPTIVANAAGQYPANPIYPPQNGPAPNGMSPPPLATFQQNPLNTAQPPSNNVAAQQFHKDANGGISAQQGHNYTDRDAGSTSIPDMERAYQEFLHEEAKYTTQGQWERFPPGSRLFIGNLFTEKVSKRDLFYIFRRYGRLAQISMKSAYGFIQFVSANDCNRAMQTEQGRELGGRKINLEISKPQKNTRNAAASGGNPRSNHGRRSRSPERRNGPRATRPGTDRFERGVNVNDFPVRGRDDYRPARSPSPRGHRGHDSYRGGRDRSADRYYGGRRSRSRSPYGGRGTFRNRSPKDGEMEDEATLPIPRRPQGSAPDVQIIIAEEVDRTFIGFIQEAFRGRGLRCEALKLPPRASMSAVVKRQILENVQAVVKIYRRSQINGKIPLQVFNRSQGHNNVQFDEYEDLDANVAAEIVLRAKSTHMAPPQTRPQYPPAPNYPSQQYSQMNAMTPQPGTGSGYPPPQKQPQGGPPANVANLITSMDGPSLQKLLSSMAQNQQAPRNPLSPQSAGQPGPDLSALLSSVASQQGKQPGMQQQPYQPQGGPPAGYPAYGPSPPQQYQQGNGQMPGNPLQNNPALSQLLSNRQMQPGLQSPNQQPPQQQNVQDIMAQLARYR